MIIDLAKLRAKTRNLVPETIFSMLDDAFDLLPPAKLEQLIKPYLHVENLLEDQPTAKRDSPACLKIAVENFAVASRSGNYFETFDVNWKNCLRQSNGTTAWIAECHRLLHRCVALASRRREVDKVVTSFELLFDLIDDAGSCELDIVFFADEGGTYVFGIHWQTVIPAWFECFTRQTLRDGSHDKRTAGILEQSQEQPGEALQKMAEKLRARARITPHPEA